MGEGQGGNCLCTRAPDLGLDEEGRRAEGIMVSEMSQASIKSLSLVSSDRLTGWESEMERKRRSQESGMGRMRHSPAYPPAALTTDPGPSQAG